jgi:hypothetical protein
MTTNTTNISKFIINIVESGEAFKSGPFDLIAKNRNEISALNDRVRHAVEAGNAVRSVVIDFFRGNPEGEKLLEAHEGLKGKGKSKNEKERAKALHKRIESVNALLQRTCEVYDVIDRLSAAEFNVRLSTVKGTAVTVCKIAGPDDDSDDAKPMSVEAMRRLADISFTNIRTVDALLFTTGRNKGANKEKGSNGEKIAPSKIGEAIDNLDTTLAGFDIEQDRDNGIPPIAMNKLKLHYAMLHRCLSANMRSQALAEYDALADDAKVSQAA